MVARLPDYERIKWLEKEISKLDGTIDKGWVYNISVTKEDGSVRKMEVPSYVRSDTPYVSKNEYGYGHADTVSLQEVNGSIEVTLREPISVHDSHAEVYCTGSSTPFCVVSGPKSGSGSMKFGKISRPTAENKGDGALFGNPMAFAKLPINLDKVADDVWDEISSKDTTERFKYVKELDE